MIDSMIDEYIGVKKALKLGIYDSQVRKDAWKKRDNIFARICLKPLILLTF